MARQYQIPGGPYVNTIETGREYALAGYGYLNSELAAGNQAIIVTDGAGGIDTLPSVSVSMGLSDSASGADGFGSRTASLTVNQNGSGIEIPTISGALGIFENAAGVDVIVKFDEGVKIAYMAFSFAQRSMKFKLN